MEIISKSVGLTISQIFISIFQDTDFYKGKTLLEPYLTQLEE